MIGTFAISYANSSIQEIEEHPEKEIEVYCKPHEAIYSDATFTCGIISDPKSARLIGSKGHFISEDGQTIQHSEITPMEADEYPELIADPFGYTFNKMLPRKAKKLDEAYPESYNAVRDLIEHMKSKALWKRNWKKRSKKNISCRCYQRMSLPADGHYFRLLPRVQRHLA
jgi:hypothetical protein